MASGDLTIKLDEQAYTQVYAKLIGLSEFQRNGIIYYGLRRAARIIADKGKSNLRAVTKTDAHNVKMAAHMANKKGGTLIKSISVNVNKKKIKSLGGFKRPPGYVAHFNDFGTVDRYTKKGAFRGRMPATHFWTDAFNSKKDEAFNELNKTINKCIDAIMNK